MYRHDSHTQALMPLNVDAIVAVAPADTDFSIGADLDQIRAFLLHPLDCFVLHQGTWHWGPFPLGPEPVRLLNVQGRGYARRQRIRGSARSRGRIRRSGRAVSTILSGRPNA